MVSSAFATPFTNVVVRGLLSSCLAATAYSTLYAQVEPTGTEPVSPQVMLRGSITPEREWWNLLHYDLSVEFFPDSKEIKGTNVISFEAVKAGDKMQVDLQPPLSISGVQHQGDSLEFEREGNVYWVSFPKTIAAGTAEEIKITYAGKPVESERPPWRGGITWKKDSQDNHFIATTCYGIGASVWWPCKDHGYDEPDHGLDIRVTVPEQLSAVANGRLLSTLQNEEKATKTFHWKVTQPINNYCVNVNIGDYVTFSETFAGESGGLDMNYWVLREDRERAVKQFLEAPRVIEAFEYWFGPYPFYEDSYKLVHVPYSGMEHQSSVTYGNGFRNGYGGRDLSKTGVGFKFDFIIVHESGHEWFGNNISMVDPADMWIHESFTNYSENLFVEYFFTQKDAEDYVIGCRRLVNNKTPIIREYNVNAETPGDTYYKGGNMLHTIRHVVDNDIKWRRTLRGLNSTFRHQTVRTKQIEEYMSKSTGVELQSIFDQYLRTTKIPRLKYKIDGRTLIYRYEDVVEGFAMPIKVRVNDQHLRLRPTKELKEFKADELIDSFGINRNFFVIGERD